MSGPSPSHSVNGLQGDTQTQSDKPLPSSKKIKGKGNLTRHDKQNDPSRYTTLVLHDNPRYVMADKRLGPNVSPHFLYLPAKTRDCVFIADAATMNAYILPNIHMWDGPPPVQPSPPCYRVAPCAGKGLGLLAQRSISRGEIIMEERPILFTSRFPQTVTESDIRGFFDLNALQGLSQASRDAIMHMRNSYPSKPSAIAGILRTNCLPLDFDPLSGDSKPEFAACFPTLSRANHSCSPSANFYFSSETFTAQVLAMRNIAEGEEITISYCGVVTPFKERQAAIQRAGNFTCACEVCTLPPALLAQSDARRAALRAFFVMRPHGRFCREELAEILEDATEERLWYQHAMILRTYPADEDANNTLKTLRALRRAREALVAVEGPRSFAVRDADHEIQMIRGAALELLQV